MSLHVKGQVVRAGEGPVTQHALIRFLARVLPVVTRQFIGAGELPAAAFPWTAVRLLSCKIHIVVSTEVQKGHNSVTKTIIK